MDICSIGIPNDAQVTTDTLHNATFYWFHLFSTLLQESSQHQSHFVALNVAFEGYEEVNHP